MDSRSRSLVEPLDLRRPAALASVCAYLGVESDDSGWRLVVPQVDVDGRMVDTADRIRLGADVIRRLADAGL